MSRMILLARASVAVAAGFALLLPSSASAGSEEVTTVTLPPAPTLSVPSLPTPQLPVPGTSSSVSGSLTVPTITVPQLQVPTLPTPQLPVPGTSSSVSGSLTVPTIMVPQLQVPTISVPALAVPQLQVPTISVPQLQIPTLTVPPLVTPELPAITVPQPIGVSSTPTASTPRRDRNPQGSTQVVPNVVTPQVAGLISPEMLLEMLRVQQAETAVELVAPQEATTTDRLPIGTFAAFGGGVALVSFALSLLRRRDDRRTSVETEAA